MRDALLRILCALVLLTLAGCPEDPQGDDDDSTEDVGPIEAPVLEVSHDPEEDLTELAVEAVALVPDWLRDDLVLSLLRLDDEVQDDLARLVVDEEDHYLIDEIAFAIAHTSPEVLAYHTFYPELLTLNAEMIYEVDPVLDYVQLEDMGEPGVDEDYYTTATYRVGDGEGNVTEKTIDREIYYWYVVHPRLEDELPLYVDGWSSGNGTSPTNGLFWREFLWDRARDECPEDRECPLLSEALVGIDTLWESRAGTAEDNGAMGALVHFVWDAMDWGAGDERPVQPNRIYAVARGNCGEHADMASSAARTGLVPCRNVGARSNDHTWDEFWDDRWVGWEPIGTHVDYKGYYKGGISRDRIDNDCDGFADDAWDSDDLDGDGFAVSTGDCDDTNADVHPLAEELANGYDDDCDGVADPGFQDAEVDADGDGHTIGSGDCDETDPAIYPGADAGIDGVDNDCDGIADAGLDELDTDMDTFTILLGDCDDNDPAVYPGAVERGNAKDDDCDGIADNLAWDVYGDVDGDGYAVTDGDCDDSNPQIHPGAAEVDNLVDDDCDGVADDGFGLEDMDGDGVEPLFGDCNDADPDIHPMAEETCNGIDDDCDGVADEGLYGSDRDGDGFTLADGDCNDMSASCHPDRQDPGLSGNRLYAMTAARGDTFIDETLTEEYVTLPSYLEFEVSDEDGRPVDGALVIIYGTWAVYGYEDQWAWAAEVVTDVDGHAEAVVGEFNPYGYAVYSGAGDDPGGDYLYEGVELSEPFETYVLTSTIPGKMPAAPAAEETDLTDGLAADVTLQVTVALDGYRLEVDGSYAGSFSREQEGGRLDVMLVDEGELEAFEDGDDFGAQLAELDSEGGDWNVDIPLDREWTLVLGNTDALTAAMVGSVTVTAVAADGVEMTGEVTPIERRFRIPAGDYLAIEISAP